MRPVRRVDPLVVYDDHPLFPVDEGDTPPNVAFIHVTRWMRGRQFFGPCLKADELVSEDQIAERFGGGDFELMARAPGKKNAELPGLITKRRRVQLPGKPRPLSPQEDEDDDDASAAPAAPPAAAGSSAGILGGPDNVVLAILQMNQAAQERAAQAQQASSQQFLQLMTALLSSSKNDAAKFTEMMLQMSNSQSATLTSLFGAILSSRGGGGPDELLKYAQLFKSFQTSEGPASGEASGSSDDSIGSIVSNVADIIHGFTELKNGAAPPLGPEVPPEPGSAASVLMGGK